METYVGHVKSPQDAIVLFEACRLGQLPRVQRRLSEKERQLIKSGSVFVWDEREAGMRRWTDGKSWSASRVNGSFLTYREMEGKKGSSSVPATTTSTQRQQSRVSPGRDEVNEGMGDAPDGYRYRPDGLTKQSFSITTSTGQHLHLISYFSRSDLNSARLMLPSQDPSLRHIRPEKGMYPESTLQDNVNTPALTRSPMVSTTYATSPHASAASTPQYAQPRSMAHAYSPAYNYPPSPMHTPPLAGTPSAHHYSPYANGHAAGPQLYQGQHPPHHRVAAGPTAFDRIPSSQGASHMPPPSALQATGHGYPAQSLPPTSAPTHPYYAPPSYAQSTPPVYSSLPPSNHLPPLRKSASPHDPSGASISERPAQEPGNERTPPRTAAGTIPSIGALINESPPAGGRQGPPQPPLAHRQNLPTKRPGESNLGGFPDKKPYTEDTRALRQLDRAFAL